MATCQCALIAKVRADERERNAEMNRIVGRDFKADLRAKVEALPLDFDAHERPVVLMADVLALFDGGGDE
jgi:hypothetical protein